MTKNSDFFGHSHTLFLISACLSIRRSIEPTCAKKRKRMSYGSDRTSTPNNRYENYILQKLDFQEKILSEDKFTQIQGF